MTFKEKLQKEHPELVSAKYFGGCASCPHTYGYESEDNKPCRTCKISCRECWNREFPWPKKNPHLDGLSAMVYLFDELYGAPKINMPSIKKVIFNDPATIVIWADNTKTVVKCQNGEPYDPEKGLAMAITKRALGNKGNYFDEIKKWTKEYTPKKAPVPGISEEEFVEGLKKLANAAKIGRRG